MRQTMHNYRIAHLACLAMLLVAFESFPVAGAICHATSFPDSVQCTVQPYYRHRPDGTPGREIILKFKGARLYGSIRLDISAGKIRENHLVTTNAEGADSLVALLPPDLGVSNESPVKIRIQQGQRALERTIVVPPMRHWNVLVYPHSHVDIGYSNTHANVEFIHKRNIDQGIKLAEATRGYPDGARYLWNTEVMWPFERYFAGASPEKRLLLTNAVKRGQICLDAAYVHLLTTSCSDEEMLQALRTRAETVQRTGKEIDTYVQVDVPGMAWGLVQALAHEGVRYVMLMPNGGRGNGPMVSAFERKPFWWVGQDGVSKVLFLNAGGYGAGMQKGGKTGRPWFGQRDKAKIPDVIKTDNPRADFLDQHLFNALPEMERAHYPYDIYVVTWAMWDNALLDADLPAAVKSWNADYAYPHLIISNAHNIMQTFERRYGDRLPVVKGDFTEYWTDGMGTAAREARMNRNAKDRLVQAETVWPMLHSGTPAPRADFDEAWRNVLLGTEHTFTTENPTEPFFQDAIWRMKQHYFSEADNRSRNLLDEALAPASDKSNGALGPAAGPSNGGIAVINTHSWRHGGVVILPVAESQIGDRVIDDRGNDVVSQRLSTGELAFLASDVAPFGSRHYRVVTGKCSITSPCRFAGTSLANGVVDVVLDRRTGNIVRLTDISSTHNFVDLSANDGANAFRWQPGRGMGSARPDSVVAISLKEPGPLVGEIQVTSSAPGCRSVTRSVRLIWGQPWVEITNTVDKLPLLAKDGVHFGFAFNVPGSSIHVDIPWGVMRVEDDQWPAANRAWMAAQHFVDVSNDTAGITWCSLDAPLIESGSITANNTASWDGVGDVWPAKLPRSSTIYSWVMNNHWFTNTPLTQDGPVTFRYRIQMHAGYDAARAYRFGVEQSQPLIALAANNNPIAQPVVVASNDRVAVSILKSSADGKSMILRLRSLSEQTESVKLTWPARKPSSVLVCERGETPGKVDASSEVAVAAMGYTTLRIAW
jgi:alpha-mannosidase